ATGFGYTDTTKKKKVDESTIYCIGSVSKIFTVFGVMSTANDHTWDIDDPVVKYYPGFSIHSMYNQQDAGKITIGQLISHHAGFSSEVPVGGNWDNTACTLEEHVKSLNDSWLRYSPGERYSYSNAGYDLAGYLLERVLGEKFPDNINRVILRPLGMNRS